MDPAIVEILIKDLLVPLVMNAVRAHQAATNGTTPTDAQVIAALPADAAFYTSIGQAFLAATKPTG